MSDLTRDQHIARLLEQAPPLTEQQQQALARILPAVHARGAA